MELQYTFEDFLKAIWKDNTAEEAIHLWKWQITNYPDAAKHYLDSIAIILQFPPDNFIEIAQENGWIFLDHEDKEGNIIPYTFAEYIAWFQEMNRTFKGIYDEYRGA